MTAKLNSNLQIYGEYQKDAIIVYHLQYIKLFVQTSQC